ncbi:MAG: hypothetical protein GX053_12580 [Tissierella sp.]|nr:hypothetical protein [Tissierella sp.]
MNMKGFTYANIHSSEYELYVRSDNRTITPSLRKNDFVIPGRHGTIDYGLNTYETRLITMELSLVRKTMLDLRVQARDIAQWFSKSGILVFDDEPDKAYQAKVYANIDIEEIRAYGKARVTFECQPFAESLEYRQVNIPNITNKPRDIPLNVSGTSETGCIITIKNNGTTNINNIVITRKAGV